MNEAYEDPDDVFEAAVAAHEAGELRRAEHLYRQVIELAGEDAVVLELLGAALFGLERSGEALEALDRSLALDSSSPSGWLHRAEARLATGDHAGSESDLRRCLALDPAQHAASIALVRLLLLRGDPNGALSALPGPIADPSQRAARESLRLEIDLMRGCSSPSSYDLSGHDFSVSVARASIALLRVGRFEDAAAACEIVRDRHPDAPDPVAAVLSSVEIDAPDVAAEFRRAIGRRLLGEVAEQVTRGLQAASEGDSDRALANLIPVVETRPELSDLAVVLASILRQTGRANDAVRMLAAPIERSPEHAGLHREHGRALVLLHRHAEGEASLRKSISLRPDQHDVRLELASMLLAMGRSGDAMELVRAVPPHDASRIAASSCAADILASSLRQHEAIATLREALDRNPEHPILQSQLVYLCNFPDGLREADIASEHRHRARLMLPSGDAPRSDAERRSALRDVLASRRRIRLAFLSPDLRRHSVWYFIEPLLASLDRERFEVMVFSDVVHPDGFTEQIRRHCDLWIPVSHLDDPTLTEHLRRFELDILIELSGHTNRNRLAALASRVAPVQASYLGYPNTTGIGAMDFRIVDGITDPPGSESLSTESLLRMPRSFLCFRQDPDAPPPAAGRPPRPVTFGCFNNLMKVTLSTLRCWAAALEEIPGSRLVVKSRFLDDPIVASRLVSLLDGFGVDPTRLTLLRRTSDTRSHLSLYGEIDVALDTFPYHGTTTTCEALSMGVPVVTLAGEGHRSRVGASLLHATGLGDLVSIDERGFGVAAGLAAGRANRPRADLLRDTCITDPRGFAVDFLAMLVEGAAGSGADPR